MAYNFTSFIDKGNKTLDHLRQDIGALRTGRASAQLLDIVTVEAYGSRMKINEVANVSVPDPSLIVVTPWDKSLLGDIEKAISISGLNLPPVVDSNLIRISVPPLTEERRKEMVKLLHQKIESGRVMMRNVRADAKKEIDKMKEEGVSEDEVARDLQELEKKVKEFMDKIDKLAQDKEKELMTV
jgi:ribosome recycling factor